MNSKSHIFRALGTLVCAIAGLCSAGCTGLNMGRCALSVDMPVIAQDRSQARKVPTHLRPWDYYQRISHLDEAAVARERSLAESDQTAKDTLAHRLRLALVLSARPANTDDLRKARALLLDLPSGGHWPQCDPQALMLYGSLIEKQIGLSDKADQIQDQIDVLRQKSKRQRDEIATEKKRAAALSSQLGRLKAIEKTIDAKVQNRPTLPEPNPDAEAKSPTGR